MKRNTLIRIGSALALVTLFGTASASADPWRFGVMGDTQWTLSAETNNPNSVAVSIIKQLNPQFINADVKFVVQVGDVTDNGSTAAITTTAIARQALYDAGIGFYPLRGNHESSQTAALQFTNDFPQTQGLGTNVHAAVNFTSAANALTGLSYAFDYNNARFVLLDQFTRLDGTGSDVNNAIVDQGPWVDATLSSRAAGTHAFVFTHKNLIGQNHVDCLFGANPAANPATQNTFIGSLSSNAVGYVMSGHDHVHQRSVVTSPDGLNTARQIICASDSTKFYTPAIPSLDQQYNTPRRETSVAQDLYRVGYYIVTVDGPKVTVEYYASDETFPSGNTTAPTLTLHFQKRETFGYSLNGQEFPVAQGQSYVGITDGMTEGDGFLGTGAAILGGTNGSTKVDGSTRPLTKVVSTGWTTNNGTFSDVLTLLGMSDVGTTKTDNYALAMQYVGTGLITEQLQSGTFALCTRNAYGRWIRAVDANSGGTNVFVFGPWNASYGLGTYGVDTAAGTVWAVVNHDGDFAAAQTQIAEPGYIAGDFHQHTTFSDGSNPFATVMAKNNEFGLDWWANSEHGGKFNKNAAGPILTSGFDTGAYAQFWDVLGIGILGDPTGLSSSHTNMWRWQSLRDFSFADLQTARAIYTNKTLIQGVEWNVPGHEHCSVSIIANEFGPGANAQAAAQFEYLWDANDADVSGGLAQGWAGKITVNNHAKATNAVAWMQANYPSQGWTVFAHPERKGYGSAGGGYSVADFRDLNNAGPSVAIGFESMPGHQKESGRGGYGTGAAGGGTYGGCGIYAAKVGGLWDAMLGEGRSFWLFASSDFHNTGGDFWPGEYQKNYSYVADKTVADSSEAAQQIANSLRSGRNWVVEGDLIDSLEFTAAGAVMGSKVFITNNTVTLNITVHDPEGINNGPAGHNMPVLNHIDVIAGEFGGLIAPTNSAYTNAENATARVIARFDGAGGVTDTAGLTSTAWADLGGGWKQMTLTFDTQNKSSYFRLRGSNLGLGVANETDGAGNPLSDTLVGPNDATKAFDDLWFYSNPVFVQVDQAPTISLTSPTNGASFVQGYAFALGATATDDSGVANVSFYANGNLLGTDTTSPYQYIWSGATVGTHEIRAVVTDNIGQTVASTSINVSVYADPNAVDLSGALRVRVAAGSDDAEENRTDGSSIGNMDVTSSDLELIQDGSKVQLVGMKFNNISIPQGAKIQTAYIQFTTDEIGSKNINPFAVSVFGEATDNAATYTSTSSNIVNRARTTASVAWNNVPDWLLIGEAGPAQRTPNLASVVQEIVDRPGWAAGNSLALMVQGVGGRCADAYEDGASLAPQLVIVLEPPALSIGQSNGNVLVTWPIAQAQGFQLQFKPDLNSTNWVPVSSSGFFRLVKP